MLTKMTEEYVERVRRVEKEFINMIGAEEILDMDENELVMLKKLAMLLDDSCNLVVEQANLLDEINGKLDKLIAKK